MLSGSLRPKAAVVALPDAAEPGIAAQPLARSHQGARRRAAPRARFAYTNHVLLERPPAFTTAASQGDRAADMVRACANKSVNRFPSRVGTGRA
jgi:hypothetical protein